ncbi:hypothetical protein V8C40DRAFT_255679 [Trichoderma camerunense]
MPLVLLLIAADCRCLASLMTNCHCHYMYAQSWQPSVKYESKYEPCASQQLLLNTLRQEALPFQHAADQCLFSSTPCTVHRTHRPLLLPES